MERIMKISSQEFTKNGKFQILEKISNKVDNKYVYKLKLKCIDCGEEQIVLQQHKERCKCTACRKRETDVKHIGEVHGCYKILEFDHVLGNTRYYKVVCTKCGTESIKSYHNILSGNESCRKCKGNSRTPTLQAPRNRLYDQYIRHAYERGLEFNLTDEEFDDLIFSNCHYCNSEPSSATYLNSDRLNKTNQEFKNNGIDRIDSSKGYTIDNCVPCCPICNRMKLNYSLDLFKSHISKIYNYYIVNEGSTTISKESTHKCVETGDILD